MDKRYENKNYANKSNTNYDQQTTNYPNKLPAPMKKPPVAKKNQND